MNAVSRGIRGDDLVSLDALEAVKIFQRALPRQRPNIISGGDCEQDPLEGLWR